MNQFISGLTAVFLLVISMATMADGSRQDIHASADLVQPLLAGMEAPEFSVKSVEGKDFDFQGGELDKPPRECFVEPKAARS